MSLVISSEIVDALAASRGVVALESTIIAHGMPYPENFRMAQDVEQVIRAGGAVPATIAIISGQLRVGLSSAELQTFAERGAEIMKVSTRDIPYVVARGIEGATTVASTMRIAAVAGIRVFATGGIGGVHRGFEGTLDISNDLVEFTHSNVAVVTAGAKAILDLPATLEVLETHGVPVVGFGTDEFPAFYSRRSGLKVPLRLDAPKAVAALLRTKWEMGLKGGVVIANPIPREYEIPVEAIAPLIAQAVAEVAAQRITGKHVTPFLLKRLAEITQGKSLAANIALVMNNAKLAARIARRLG